MTRKQICKIKGILLFALLSAVFCGCMETKHEIKTESVVAPIEIKPIQIAIDINVKVDQALDDFFGNLDEME